MTRTASTKALRLMFAGSILAIAGLTSACSSGSTVERTTTTTDRSTVVAQPTPTPMAMPMNSSTTVTKTQTVTP